MDIRVPVGTYGSNKVAKSSSGTGTLSQTSGAASVIGKSYNVEYTISNYSVTGTLTIGFGGGTAAPRTISADGTYIDVVTATSTSGIFNITPSDGIRLSIDNVSVSAVATYSTGTNTTVFNGTAVQTFTINLAGNQSLNKLTIDKPAGIALNLAGSQSIDVASDFRLVLGTFSDNGKSVNIAGNVYNSGIHTGSGKISLNGSLSNQSIDGNGIFGNIDLNNTFTTAAPVSLAANMTLNGQLTFTQNKLFDINTYNLKFNSTATIAGASTNRYIKSAGNAGDGGVTKVYSSSATFDFPVGVNNYTPGSIGFNGTPAVLWINYC